MTTVPKPLQHIPAQVQTTPSGAPERLIWQGRTFHVMKKPIPWVDRKSWWSNAPRAPIGFNAAILEQPMWQVQGRADDGQILIFDLTHTDAQWWITHIYD